MSPELKAAPHLWVTPGSDPGPAGMTYLGTITRDYQGEPLAPYSVYISR